MEIADYPNYLVYEDGRVSSKRFPHRFLKPYIDKYGYHAVNLWKDSKNKLFKVHRLVALAYIPNPDNKREVDHIDRNRTNNDVSNLRWATRSENTQNTRVSKNNKLGIKNISWHKHKQRYRYHKVLRGVNHCKYFKTLEEALAYKQEYESTLI